MTKKIGIAVLVGALVVVNICMVLAYIKYTKQGQVTQSITDIPGFSAEMLQQYDGTNPDKPVYLGLNGFVYDITPGRADFYDPGQPYHFIAGRDSSQELNMVGGEIIRRKYKIVGRLVK